MRTPSLDNITALNVTMAFAALYSLYKGGQLFISAIKALHNINKLSGFEAFSSSQFANNSDPSTQGIGNLFSAIGQGVSRSRYEALASAAIGGFLMYNAYSTGSTLVAGEDLGVARTVVNAGIALLGVNNVIRRI